MITFDFIRGFFPGQYGQNPLFRKYMLMEYLQLMILDYLAGTPYLRKLVFIGGTSLRLVRGIDRWSEDLDFDCKDLTSAEFEEMSDGIAAFLNRSGLRVETKPGAARLKAFRTSILFPGLLHDMGLTGHREERMMIKIEAQDQGVPYSPEIAYVKGCGFFIPMPVPPMSVLASMKIAAMLNRQKGRDFYDLFFLLSTTSPDYAFLEQRCGIDSKEELRDAVEKILEKTDLQVKMRDFEHLLLNRENSRKILHTHDLFRSL